MMLTWALGFSRRIGARVCKQGWLAGLVKVWYLWSLSQLWSASWFHEVFCLRGQDGFQVITSTPVSSSRDGEGGLSHEALLFWELKASQEERLRQWLSSVFLAKVKETDTEWKQRCQVFSYPFLAQGRSQCCLAKAASKCLTGMWSGNLVSEPERLYKLGLWAKHGLFTRRDFTLFRCF